MNTKKMTYFFLLCDALDYNKYEAEEAAKKRYSKGNFLDISDDEIDTLIAILEKEKEPTKNLLGDFPCSFRVWDLQEHKMIYNVLNLEEYFENKNRFHIMQYTGIRDVNAKQIFDFDFIMTYSGAKNLVQWGWTECGWVGKEVETDATMRLGMPGGKTVIGNIYEGVKDGVYRKDTF